jgi:hypothetical protein
LKTVQNPCRSGSVASDILGFGIVFRRIYKIYQTPTPFNSSKMKISFFIFFDDFNQSKSMKIHQEELDFFSTLIFDLLFFPYTTLLVDFSEIFGRSLVTSHSVLFFFESILRQIKSNQMNIIGCYYPGSDPPVTTSLPFTSSDP